MNGAASEWSETMAKTFTVNMAPSWAEMAPIFCEVLMDPKKADLHWETRQEICRMAKLADLGTKAARENAQETTSADATDSVGLN